MIQFDLAFHYRGMNVVVHVSKMVPASGNSSYVVEVEEAEKFNITESIMIQSDQNGKLAFYFRFGDELLLKEIAKQILYYCHHHNISIR